MSINVQELRETVTAALVTLGNTADEVAASLREKGITGHVSDSGLCPIANYIKTLLPADSGLIVAVSESGYALREAMHGGDMPCIACARDDAEFGIYIEPVPAVTQFIYAFDSNDYPDLRVTA